MLAGLVSWPTDAHPDARRPRWGFPGRLAPGRLSLPPPLWQQHVAPKRP